MPDGPTLEESVKNHAEELYRALETIVRQNAGGFPVGHDAFLTARKVLAAASLRKGEQINWAQERLGVQLCKEFWMNIVTPDGI